MTKGSGWMVLKLNLQVSYVTFLREGMKGRVEGDRLSSDYSGW